LSKYDEIYDFKIASTDDADRILFFIKRHWQENHIFVIRPDFFQYEFRNPDETKQFNFVICEKKITKCLIAIHGFIPYSFHAFHNHVCGAITVVDKLSAIPMLGIELMKQFVQLTNYTTYCGIGTNPKTMVPIARSIFKRHVGKMEHYYRLNPNNIDFKVASIGNRDSNASYSSTLNIPHQNQAKLIRYNSIEEVKKNFDLERKYRNLPLKQDWYIQKRFFKHPIYNYTIFGVSINDSCRAILIAREVLAFESKILRFVDFIGDTAAIAHLRQAVTQILIEGHYEYIDFISHGLDQQLFLSSGFTRKDESDVNIIPNYFEPFERQNVEVWFEKTDRDMALFRADADGDRPSKI